MGKNNLKTTALKKMKGNKIYEQQAAKITEGGYIMIMLIETNNMRTEATVINSTTQTTIKTTIKQQ